MAADKPLQFDTPTDPPPSGGTCPAGAERPAVPVTPPAIPDFALLRRIGSGSYGDVWLARDVFGQHRAMKIVYRRDFADDRPFRREFEGIKKFEPISRSHPSQLAILHAGRNDALGCFYYAMELADSVANDAGSQMLNAGSADLTRHPGSSIQDPASYSPHTLRHDLETHQRLPVNGCIEIGLSLTTALAHLHKHGLVHRDIKPSNIIFVNGVPKLADIGLVTDAGDARSIVGTEGYLAKEGPGTPQADIYALGKVLYEMSMGRHRRDFPDLPLDWQNLPERMGLLELNEILLKACAQDYRQRYQSAEELASDLSLLQSGRSVKHFRAVERRLAIVTNAGMVTALIALAAVAAYFGAVRQTQRARRAEKDMAQQLYVSDMNRAYQFWDKGNVRRALELLETHRPRASDREDLRSFEWFYLWRLCHRDEALRTFVASSNAVASIAFSADGTNLGAASGDRTAVLWDRDSGQKLAMLTNVDNLMQSTSLAPGFGMLACGTDGGMVVLWNLVTKQVVATLAETGMSNTFATLSPDGKVLATAKDDDDSVTLWDTGSKRVIERLRSEEGGYISSVAFSPDGKILVAGRRDNLVTFWEMSSRRKIADLDVPMGFVSSLVFSPDGRSIALAGMGSVVVLCDLASRKITDTLAGHESEVTAAAFSPDSQMLATGSSDTTVKLWNAFRHQLAATLKGHLDGVTTVAFSPDGKTIASGCVDGSVKLWAVAAKPDSDVLAGHTNWARSVAFSPDGQMLASAGKDKTVRLWDVARCQWLSTLEGHRRPVCRLAWSPDGRTLATVSGLLTEEEGLGEVKLWDAIERKELATLTNLNNPVCSVGFSPDGRTLATGNGNGAVMLWNVANQVHIATFRAHKDHVNSVAFSHDGKVLATGSDDNTAKLWEVTTRRELAVIPGSLGNHPPTSYGIWSVSFSPDRQTLALGNDDGTVMLWSLAKRRLVRSFRGTASKANSVTFTPDGRTLVVGNQDNVVTLWNVATGQELAVLKGHKGFVESVALSPDGSTLASASSDKTLRLWRAATREETDAGAKAK